MPQRESSSESGSSISVHAAEAILEGIVRKLVYSPDGVAVHSVVEGDGALLTVAVSSSDFDIITGSGGRTSRSLQTVLTALGKRSGQRFSLDIQSNAP